VAGGGTVLDYAFTLSPTPTGGSLRVSGFLADDRNRLDFALAAASQSGALEQSGRVTFDLALPAQRFHATGSVEAATNGSAGAVRIDVSVAIGADLIHFSGASNGDVVSVAISANGRLLATITGDPHHPIVRGSDGRELSPAETLALGGLVSVVYRAIEMVEHLLEPVALLLGLGGSLSPPRG
jgi:hypothetical protein